MKMMLLPSPSTLNLENEQHVELINTTEATEARRTAAEKSFKEAKASLQ